MIYINELSSVISIPKHSVTYSDRFTVVLSSHLTNEFIIVNDEENISTNFLYYKFPITQLEIPVGEYTYKVISPSSEVVETGLLVYGNYQRGDVVSNTFSKQIIQYEG